MSLATRCPACGTTFRVVQDQLKVSDGWVRCGQCQEVFNALETLFELPAAPTALADEPPVRPDRGGAPAVAPFTDIDLGESEPSAPAGAGSDAEQHLPIDEETWPAGPDPVQIDGGPQPASDEPGRDPDVQTAGPPERPPAASPTPEPAQSAGSEDEDEAADGPLQDGQPSGPDDDLAGVGPESEPQGLGEGLLAGAEAVAEASFDLPPVEQSSPTDDAADAPSPAWTHAPEARWERKRSRRARRPAVPQAEPAAEPSAAPDPSAAPARGRRRKPEFMRRVERAAHWQRPAVRAVLGSAAAVLLLLLGGQAGWAFRDDLAARWPVLAPPLAQTCRLLGCELAAPRSLEHLVIDSSQLSRTAWPETLRLTADLRNTAAHPVRAPALELRFTDPNGRTLVRKVLLSAELAASAPPAIDADDSWHVDALLAVGSLKVSGFSAEVFYP